MRLLSSVSRPKQPQPNNTYPNNRFMLQLRDYQQHAVNGIRHSYLSGNRSPLLVLPTGGGKTIVFSYISANTAARGKKAIILVHRVELLRQTFEKLQWAGVKVGLINPNYTPDITAPVQVASVQTLGRRLNFLRAFDPDLIVIDEAHHAIAGTWRTCIEAVSTARVLGVTATPVRGDGKGLGLEAGGIFDDLIVGPQVADLIAAGYLVQPKVYAPLQKLDLSGVKISMGDYDKKELEVRLDKPSITGDAVDHYTRLCAGAPAVAFCVNKAHAEHVAMAFREAGYRAAAVDGDMDDANRKRILGGLGNGQVQVVTSCDLISEGTDIPAIGAAILLRPTASLGLYLQQVGRALRPCEGKDRAIILDHVGNVLTHGMPDEPREWSLAGEDRRNRGKKQAEKPVNLKQCEKCYAVHKPAPVCPSCGYKYEVAGRELQQVDGSLQEVSAEDAARIRKEQRKEVGAAKTLEDLLRIERSRGYKNGWAKHVFMARNNKQVPV